MLASFNAEVLRARSEIEARFFHLCIQRQLPPPRLNRMVDAGPERFEVDFHWPDARLIVETDSSFHDTAAAGVRDAHRDAVLRTAGWTVIRCRWTDIADDPTPLVARLGRISPPIATRVAPFAELPNVCDHSNMKGVRNRGAGGVTAAQVGRDRIVDRERSQGALSREDRSRRAWYLLVLVPMVALLIPPIYNGIEPELFGIPFFYWYQLAWVPLGVAVTWVVYRKTRRDRG